MATGQRFQRRRMRARFVRSDGLVKRFRSLLVEQLEARQLLANLAPSGTDKTVTLPEDSAYVVSVADFGFSDPNDNSLQAVRVAQAPTAGVLRIGVNPIASGTVVFVSDISAGQLTFLPAPDAYGSSYAALSFQVQDDGGITNGGADVDPTPNTLTFSVTAVNDSPRGENKTLTIPEDNSYVFSTSDWGFSDFRDWPVMNQMSGVIIAALPTAGTLTLDSAPVRVGDFISVSGLNSGQLRFAPVANANGAPYSQFMFQVVGNGSAPPGFLNTDPVPKTISINVTSVNDAPTGHEKIVAINTCTASAYTLSPADFGFYDPFDVPPDHFLAVKIGALPTLGALTLGNAVVTAGQTIGVADLNAGLLVYRPSATQSASDSFTFYVKDDGGTASGGFDVALTASAMSFYRISDPSHPPQSTDPSITAVEDVPYTFSIANFPFYNAATDLQAVTIITLPTAGSLVTNGVPVSAGQSISAADLSYGLLKFVPPANGWGTALARFTYQTQPDDGSTGLCGAPVPLPRTMTINVTPVNDPPSGADKTIFAAPGSGAFAYTFTQSDFGFSDSLDSPSNLLAAVKITTLPTAGGLSAGGVAVSPGQLVTATTIVSGSLVYSYPFTIEATPNPNQVSFTFQVQDNGGTDNGGVNLDLTPRKMTVNVPTNGAKLITTRVNAPYTFALPDFDFIRPPTADDIGFVTISTQPQHGTLTANGVVVAPGTALPASMIAAGTLVYTPNANETGEPLELLLASVRPAEGHGDWSRFVMLAINVLPGSGLPGNHPPSGTDRTISLTTCGTYQFSVADFGFSDPADVPPNAMAGVKISTLPTAGKLTLGETPVVGGQTISVGDLTAGKLLFKPTAQGDTGSPYASFTFQVQDNGGVANGGSDLDPTPNTMTIQVFSPPPPPTALEQASRTILEDTPYTFAVADFPLIWGDDRLASVTLISMPHNGLLTVDGTIWEEGRAVAAVKIAAGKVVYLPAPNVSGEPLDQILLSSRGEGDPCRLDLKGVQFTFNVLSVNDPPESQDSYVQVLSDSSYQFARSDFYLWDGADSGANHLLGVRIASLPSVGLLSFAGVPVVVGQIFPGSGLSASASTSGDVSGGGLRFTPASVNVPGFYTSFLYQVQDDGGTEHGGIDIDPTPNLMSIFVTVPVNTSPLHPWHNDRNPYDVNADGQVTEADALIVEDYLTRVGSGLPPTDPAAGPPYYDVSDDSYITPLDALMVRNVLPNSAPRFTKGPNVEATDEDGPRVIAGWARNISPGPSQESRQKVWFQTSVDAEGLFLESPSISSDGTLTFSPAPNVEGTATVSVRLQDDGGTNNGGVDTSEPQTFVIHIAKAHPLHNTVMPVDVDGDETVAPLDSLLLINYLNTKGHPVSTDALAEGEPNYDVSGDGFITPLDTVMVLNVLNARHTFPPAEGEPAPTVQDALADTLTLIADDIAQQQQQRKRSTVAR